MSDTKTFNLTITERLNVISILNDFKGNLDQLALILEDIKPLNVAEEEWEAADRQITTHEDKTQSWKWDDEKGGDKEVQFSPKTVQYITDTIDKKNEEGVFTLQDKAIITLREKLTA